MQFRTDRRRGFTLIELIVVLVILATLAALTALYFPRYQDKELVARGAGDVSGWLLIAKQRAKRDGLPTGLRFVVGSDPTINGGQPCAREVIYIQQPDDFAQGRFVGFAPESGTTKARLHFSLPTGVAFGSQSLPVQPGDLIELFGGGYLHRIDAVQASTLDLVLLTGPIAGTTPPPTTIPVYAGEVVNYRIIPQPRPIAGEQPLKFPDNVGIDFNPRNNANPLRSLPGPAYPAALAMNQTAEMSRNVPTRTDTTGTYYEILFSPAGAVIGQGTTNAQILLWVRDLSKDNNVNLLAGSGTIISVKPRTGLIAAQPAAFTLNLPLASGNDPYQFTRDARSSGM